MVFHYFTVHFIQHMLKLKNFIKYNCREKNKILYNSNKHVNILACVSEFLLSLYMNIYIWINFLIKILSKNIIKNQLYAGYSREQNRICMKLTMKNKNNS